MSKTFTKQQVELHNTADSCWVIIQQNVYDITYFISRHPENILLKYGGKDINLSECKGHWQQIMIILQQTLIGRCIG